MKVFISADIEGIAGVMRPEQCSPGTAEYQLARALMEQEVNAAIAGAFDGGASEVVVADSHALMTNLRPAEIDPRAYLVQGKPRTLSMVEGLEQQAFDGLIFVGYHAAASQKGVLAHTINGRAFYKVTINGELMSETDIHCAAAAEYQVPLWLVTGDNELERWVQQRYPATEYVCVKRAISQTTAQSLSPEGAQAQIRLAAKSVLERHHQQLQPTVTAPYRLELMVAKPVLADLFSLVPAVERLDAITIAFEAGTMREMISLLSVLSYLATTQS
ncbi:M55 family metallopeptidase [Gallaecimonas mangrovi]|uniref:M55 family metallopeptidase n=1 Tax=Gallaecimonas mangrovi TaxID=2291597 RepID=UPI000E206567|nr:M55 family metallopeptidase [Gallaecimonas mangrovi]